MAWVVVTGLNLPDGVGSGSVEHVYPGMTNWAVGAVRALYGQVARARTGRALEGLSESVFLLGRESVLEQPHRKGGVVMCQIDCEDTGNHLLYCLLGEVG